MGFNIKNIKVINAFLLFPISFAERYVKNAVIVINRALIINIKATNL